MTIPVDPPVIFTVGVARLAHELTFTEFADVTPAPFLGCRRLDDGTLGLDFDITTTGALTAAQVDAITIRCYSVNGNAETLRKRALAALDANRTYLAAPSHTASEVGAQVTALTRQVNGLIREALSLFDGTE